MTNNYEDFIRYKTFPTSWCPGCGIGVTMKQISMVLAEMGVHKNDVMIVSGIGCSGRMSTYFDTNTLHTTHGRAMTFATGIKLSRPDKMVIVVSGDGDSASIGGGHLIHAARRNIGIKLIIINNGVYGMTGGQVSPLTVSGMVTETTPLGNIEPQFDLVKLLSAANAPFVARETVTRMFPLRQVLKKSFEHEGFSAVEVLSNCHINLGRRNKMKSPTSMAKYIDEMTYEKAKAEKMSTEEKSDKLPLGIFVQEQDRQEYSKMYYNLVIPRAKQLKAEGEKK